MKLELWCGLDLNLDRLNNVDLKYDYVILD